MFDDQDASKDELPKSGFRHSSLVIRYLNPQTTTGWGSTARVLVFFLSLSA
jgi:hypothetical protein